MAGNELFIQGKKYISLKRASELSGYAKDYVGQICRCGKIKSERIGRDWFVDLEDLLCYKKNKIESIKKVLQQKENSVSSVLVQAPLDGKIDNKNKDISSRRAIEIGAIFENFKNKASGFFSTKDSWDKELFEGRGERLTAKFAKSLAYGFAVILLIFGFVRYSSKAGEIYAQLYNIGSSVKIVEIHPVRNFYGALDKLANVSLPRVEFPEISLAKNARKISDAYLATIYSTGDALTSFSVGASNKTVALLNQAKALELPEIKMPGIALPKIHKPNFSKIVLALVNVKHSVFDTASNMAFVGNIFSDTAKNILMETKNSFALFPQNVKEIVSEFLGLPAQTGVKDFFAPRSELAIDQNYNESVYQQEINSLKLELSQIKNNGFTVQSPIVQKTIVEKSVEKIISGLTSEEIDARLNETNEKLMAQILDIKNRLAYRTDSIANATVASTYQAVALTNKIDSLSGVTINNATITGTLGGLTDAMIPDSITASNYLLLSGGTISGELTITATTTLNGVAYGWPSADGSANYVLSTNGAGVLSWAAQTGGGGTINQLGQIGDVSTSTLAYGHLLMWNGVDTWQDTATSSLGITSGITSLNGQTGATQTFATSSDTNIGLTITSSGNIHTFTSNWIGSLAVSRGGTGLTSYTSGDVLYANTTSTLAGTSTANLKTTLGLNLVENTALSSWAGSSNITTLGTITSGTIGAGFTAIGDTYISSAATWNAKWDALSDISLAKGYFMVGNDAGLAQATSSIFVSSTGNIGIGTTSPYSILSISNSASTAINTPLFTIASTTAGVSTSTLFTVLANGNVGIGTTNPNNLIQVADLINFDNTTYATFLGYQAGLVNTGTYNSFVGYKSGFSNIGGYGNTFVGVNSGIENITGSFNTFLGAESGYYNTGSSNTFVGASSGNLNVIGNYNTFVGDSSGFWSDTGSNNVALGYEALYNNKAGTANTAIGVQAGYGASQETFASSTIIGYRAGYGLTTGSNNILLGYQAGDSITSASNNTIIGYQAGQTQTTATRNTFLGYQSGYLNTASDNTFIGYQAGDSNTSGIYNTFIGVSAGQVTVTGANNTFLGYQAGYSNTADDNTFIGRAVGISNTTGYSNSAMGRETLYSNTTGYSNTAMGNWALNFNQTGSNNTAVGYQAGIGVSGNSFSNNSLFGYNAGYALTTGSNNILLGYQAGDNLTTGASNIIIGYNIDAPLATSANTLNIGNLLFGTGIDGTGTTLSSGNIGIGTSSPYAKLSVVGQAVAEYFTATSTTATSTFPWLASTRSNVGTVIGGTWNGAVIADDYISSAATWNAKQAGDADLTAIAALTNTKGNLIVGGPSSAWVALGIGADGKVLTASSTATDGISWEVVAGGGGGTVTSVAMSVPTGLAISGSPITTAGTLALTYDTGYAGVLTASTTEWATAYGWGNHTSAGYLLGSNYYATTTHANISSLPSLSITKSQVSDFGTYEAPLTFNYPLTRSANVISTVATSSLNLLVNSFLSPNISQWTNDANYLTSAITSLGGQTGATQTFATSSDTNIGLTITSSGNIHTFTSNWIGSLAVSRGGTGLTSYTSGDVLYANTTSTLAGTSTANLKTTLGLNLVENTALSSWAGSTNITTLGTITAGTWNGSTIGVGFGGTGLTSATAGYVLIGNSATALQATSTLFVSPAGEFTVQGSGASGSTLTIGDTTANDAGVIFDGNAQDYYFALDDTDDALKIGLGSAIGTTPYLTVLSTGNTGIGTTSPYAKLSVWGSGASGLTKVFEAVNSASTTLFTILDNGRVGIGTTDPLQKLHVEGQCVTGDTLLPIIRQENFQFSIFNFSARGGSASGGQTISNDSISKQKQKEEFIENYNIENCLEIENCKLEIKPIVDVKAGDYVLSLNEETNKIEPHRINGLLDMGVKPIYEIETEDGKKIRTTGNHPYLARNQSKDLARLGFGTVENSYAKHSQDDNSGNDVNNGISHNKLISVFSNNNITDGGENTYDNVSDNKIINIIHNFYSGLNIKIPKTKSIIDNAEPRTSVSKLTSPEELGIKNPTTAEANNILDKSTKYLESVSNRSLVSSNSIYPHNNKISQDVNSDVNKKNTGAQWTKVVLLNVGDEIAVSAVALGEGRAVANSEALGKTLGVEERSGKTPSVEESADITFVKIKRITLLPPEQVYDIEVEGTHNFVANGIIAHNTYISGNTGIGTSTPNWNLQVAGARPFLTLSDTSALTDSKHWFLSSQGGNFYIGTSTDALNATSTYLTIDNKGYVGIGTAAPSQALSIAYGNIAFNFITAPTAPTAATGAAGNLTGNYYYKVTFITANGETELGATSNLIQPSAQQVELTNIPVSTETGVTQRKIYRTKAGTTSYWQLATLSNNTTTVYTDNIADASLPGTTNAVNRSNTTAGRFYVDGTQAGFIDKKFNLSLGIYSLNALTTGYNNVALGGYSLLNNTSGSMNLGLGYQSLFNTTTGSNNTGMGNAVLQGNTTGTGNVGLGSNALKFNQTGNYNIAIGLDAGLGVSANSISKNLAIGYQAGYALQTGADNNILIGYKTGDNITTGNTNIVIGYDIDAPSATSAKTLNIGNLIFGTGINGTGTTLSSGNIGIGTTNPLQKLHVEGQCVTGDSELITEDGKKLRIDQVKGGEYVLSLNEKTGKIVPAKIKGLLDMGVKPIYEIETEDGKKIRTTGNHSYLARNEQNKGLDFLGVMAENKETGQHQDTETNINKNVSSGNHNNKLFLTFHDGDKNNQSDYYNYAINNKWDHNLEDLARLGFGAIENSYAKHSQDDNSGNDVNNGISHNKLISVFSNNNITNDGENTYDNVSDNKIIDIIHNFYSGFNIKIPKTKSIIDNAEPRTSVSKLTSPENPGIKNPTTAEANNILDKSTKYLESVSNRSLVSSNSIYPHNNKTSQDVNSDVDKKNGAQWIKVAFLNEGDEIAVANSEALGKTLGVEEQSGKTPSVEESADITFVKIKRISLLPPEQVYDIEVEGTHNFVANGIIAHNTYISGNTGIGTTSPQALLTVGSSTLAYLLDGDRYNSLYVSGLFEIGGTGTSTMAGNLDIKGALNVGASSLYIDNTGTIKNGIWQGTSIDSTYISSSASWNNKWDLASTTIGVAYGGTGLTSATAGYALIGYNSSSFQATSTLFISPSGSVGIGTIEPTYKLDIYDVSNPQLGLINIAGSATTTFWADSVGDLRISASGGDIRAQNENIWVCSGGACGATAPAGKGNIILERALIFDNNFNIVASTTAVATSTEVYDSGGNAIIIFDEGE